MKVYTIGGYDEVGKNMTAIDVNGKLVLIDMGYDMETVVEEDQEVEQMTTTATIEAGAIPDDSQIHDRKEDVEAIIIGHGHLDHVGAVPKLAAAYDCPIVATPYTMSIIDRMIDQDRKEVLNEKIELETGETLQLDEDITLEFVNITHSIPGTALTVLHTDEGTVVYSLDYRLDDEPVLGDPPDYDRLKELGDEGVDLFIGDSTRVEDPQRGRSEETVATELQHTIDMAYDEGGAAIVSTFSSHIERLHEILDANDGRRKVAFIGRSLKEYTASAEEIDLIDRSDIEVASYRDEVQELLQKISGEREDWLIVCTGNQGEPRAALTRIAKGEYPLEIKPGDQVIYSCSVIPTPINRANRYKAEKHLKQRGARIYKDIHTSGHAKREDNRDMLRMLEPEKIIPAHGTTPMLASYAELAQEEGYTLNEDV
ncbi:MAG: RNase J family beta-CASP ribonuclease, partial [Candidatus Nanohaloarchaea archaeon]|nr:RNase J family beta-CASP ribonuclease [Candidatus Nanohaloarchaea archaeon]